MIKIFLVHILIAYPIGQALGGYLLVRKPTFHTGAIRNYTMCFIFAFVIDLLAMAWLLIMVNEKVAKKHEMEIQNKLNRIKDTNTEEGENSMVRSDKDIHPIKLLFDFENIKAMIKTITRKRINKGRIQIIFCIITMAIIISNDYGKKFTRTIEKLVTIFICLFVQAEMDIGNQFSEIVYRWGPDWIAYMSSIAIVLAGLTTLTVIPFLSKKLNWSDPQLALFGLSIDFFKMAIKGSWLSPTGEFFKINFKDLLFLKLIRTKTYITAGLHIKTALTPSIVSIVSCVGV